MKNTGTVKHIKSILLSAILATISLQPVSAGGVKSFCKHNWPLAPILLCAGATIVDGIKLARGDHKDLSWTETAKSSYKGIIGCTLLTPLIWHYIYLKRRQAAKEFLKNNPPKIKERYNNFTVKHYQVPRQNGMTECGYRAILNAECLLTEDITGLHDKKTLERKISKLKKIVSRSRAKRQIKNLYLGDTNIYSDEIEEIIKNYVTRLSQKRTGDLSVVPLKDNISIIDNLEMVNQMIDIGLNPTMEGLIDERTQHIINNISRFQIKRDSQVIILNVSGTILGADDGCYKNFDQVGHYIAVKLEYDKNKHKTIISVADSLGGYATNDLLERVYRLFSGRR